MIVAASNLTARERRDLKRHLSVVERFVIAEVNGKLKTVREARPFSAFPLHVKKELKKVRKEE